MGRLKLILRIGGVILSAVGLVFLPFHYVDAERALSAFNMFADMGSFINIGLLLLGVGLVAFVLSFLLPGEMGESYWG